MKRFHTISIIVKQKRGLLHIALFLLLISSIFLIPEPTFSNPIPVNSSLWDNWGLIPLDSSIQISMIDANVLLDIDATRFKKFQIDFSGDYVFYNHENTTELTVVAPFNTYLSSDFPEDINDSVILEINGIKQNFSILDLYPSQIDYIENYGNEAIPEDIFIIGTNAEFKGYSNTTISYSFSSQFKRRNFWTYIEIYYIVTTGRAWFGNVTERVEFKVRGMQPERYTHEYYIEEEINGRNCSITDFNEGKSYVWEWKDEEIGVYTGTLSISFPEDYRISRRLAYVIPTSVMSTILISTVGIILYKKKHKRR